VHLLWCRQALPEVLDLAERAVKHLVNLGDKAVAVDMDGVAQRIAVDLIGG